jgi:hypothetical protein
VSEVLRFGLEASERWMNVGSIRTVAAAVFSGVLLSSAAKSVATGAYDIGSPRSDEFVAASRRAFPQVSRMSRSRQCWQLPNVGTGIDSGGTVDLRSALQL